MISLEGEETRPEGADVVDLGLEGMFPAGEVAGLVLASGVGRGAGVEAGAGGGGGGTLFALSRRCAPQPASSSENSTSAATWSGFRPCTGPVFATARLQRAALCWISCGLMVQPRRSGT